jgi:hypothetical protein
MGSRCFGFHAFGFVDDLENERFGDFEKGGKFGDGGARNPDVFVAAGDVEAFEFAFFQKVQNVIEGDAPAGGDFARHEDGSVGWKFDGGEVELLGLGGQFGGGRDHIISTEPRRRRISST